MRKIFLYLPMVLLFACNNTAVQTKQEPATNNWALIPFAKADANNPVLNADSKLVFTCPILQKPVKWADKDVFNPASVVRHDTLFLLFRAEDKIGKYAGTSRIGIAWSVDGLHFFKNPYPVLYPDNDAYKALEWEGGCEDPRVTQSEDGMYVMTYTAYDGTNARLMVATSTDLYHWQKHGPAFSKAFGGKYARGWSKSGSIISTYKNEQVTAARINGQYWMYWGDQNIWAATSPDLINWTPVLYGNNEKTGIALRGIAQKFPELKIVVGTRSKKFDSDLVESGPPAMLTDKGIVLIYNSRNIAAIGDTALIDGTYAASQILMDKTNPVKVIDRMENYFIKPDRPYEITGQVNHVCFLEGLSFYKQKWFLYYGTADSKIAVAVK